MTLFPSLMLLMWEKAALLADTAPMFVFEEGGCPGTGAPGNKASIHVILLKYSQTKVCLLNWQWNEVYKSSGYSPSNRYIDRTKVPFNNSWLQTGSMYIPLMFYTCPETSLWSHTSRYWEWSYLEWVWLIMWCPSNKCGCLQTANTWRGTSSQWGYVSLSLIVCMPVILVHIVTRLDAMPINQYYLQCSKHLQVHNN